MNTLKEIGLILCGIAAMFAVTYYLVSATYKYDDYKESQEEKVLVDAQVIDKYETRDWTGKTHTYHNNLKLEFQDADGKVCQWNLQPSNKYFDKLAIGDTVQVVVYVNEDKEITHVKFYQEADELEVIQ